MKPKVTAKEKRTVRIEAEGGSATIRLIGERAQLLFLQVPEDGRRQGKGRELLKAAEAEAGVLGAKGIFCEYSDKAEGFGLFLKACGYEIMETGSILSVSAEELLYSAGVQKSLKMKFADIITTAFEDLLIFEREEVLDILNKLHFEQLPEDIKRYDYSLSFLSCDKELSPKAVLLSTMKGELLVELLLGFSGKSAEYILCVCQKFAKVLMERVEKGGIKRIYLYYCSENVIKLIRRLLDKQYTLRREVAVFRGEKALEGGAEPLERDIYEEGGAFLWRGEAETIFAQRNINDKSAWMEIRHVQ